MYNAADYTLVNADTEAVSGVNLAEAERFFARLDPDAGASWNFRCVHETDDGRKPVERQGAMESVGSDLAALNQQGYAVFVVINDGGGNDKSITRVRAVFVDQDVPIEGGGPIPEILADNPHMVVRSSPGKYHYFWRVEGLDPKWFKKAQKNAIAKYSALESKYFAPEVLADPKRKRLIDQGIHNPSRIMRVPGFLHQKKAPSPTVIHKLEAWAPMSVSRLAQTFPAVVVPERPMREFIARVAGPTTGESQYDDAEEVLEWLGADCSNAQWFQAACALKNYPWGNGLFHAWSAQGGAKYAGHDATQRMWDRVEMNNGGIATLISAAMSSGMENPATRRAREANAERQAAEGARVAAGGVVLAPDFGAVLAPPALTIIDRSGTASPEAVSVGRFGLRAIGQIRAKYRPVDWVVKNCIPANELLVLVGNSFVGKSYVAVDLACSVATGVAFQGDAVKKPGPVIYIAGEGCAGIERRITGWAVANGIDGEVPIFITERSPQLNVEAEAAEMKASIDWHIANSGMAPPSMVIVDTMAKSNGGDENSSQDVTAFTNALDRHLREPYGAAVVIVHHTGKGSPSTGRGSSALYANVAWQYVVRQGRPKSMEDLGGEYDLSDRDMRTLYCDKYRDALKPPRVRVMRFSTVDLPGWIDEDGDQITTGVIRESGNITVDFAPPDTEEDEVLSEEDEKNAAKAAPKLLSYVPSIVHNIANLLANCADSPAREDFIERVKTDPAFKSKSYQNDSAKTLRNAIIRLEKLAVISFVGDGRLKFYRDISKGLTLDTKPPAKVKSRR